MNFIGIILGVVAILAAYLIGKKIGSWRRDNYWEGEILGHRKDAIAKSRAVLGGQFSEQLAPFLPGFNYSPTECRFIGKPIDLIVFKGMDGKDISEVVFVEVKSGNAKLSLHEKKLKETIENGNVRWEEYRVPDEVTREKS